MRRLTNFFVYNIFLFFGVIFYAQEGFPPPPPIAPTSGSPGAQPQNSINQYEIYLVLIVAVFFVFLFLNKKMNFVKKIKS